MSIDWPLATSSWDEDEITAIDLFIRSFYNGAKSEFEENFANFTGTKVRINAQFGVIR